MKEDELATRDGSEETDRNILCEYITKDLKELLDKKKSAFRSGEKKEIKQEQAGTEDSTPHGEKPLWG